MIAARYADLEIDLSMEEYRKIWVIESFHFRLHADAGTTTCRGGYPTVLQSRPTVHQMLITLQRISAREPRYYPKNIAFEHAGSKSRLFRFHGTTYFETRTEEPENGPPLDGPPTHEVWKLSAAGATPRAPMSSRPNAGRHRAMAVTDYEPASRQALLASYSGTMRPATAASPRRS
jgi:hypothetical protein